MKSFWIKAAATGALALTVLVVAFTVRTSSPTSPPGKPRTAPPSSSRPPTAWPLKGETQRMTPHAAMLQDLPVFRPAMARLLDQKRRSEATGLTASGAPSLAAVDARYPAEVVRRLVVKIFTRMAGVNQVPMALCVADRESHFDPLAKNPFSGASGVFQWIPSSWASYSARYGFGESSVFDPMANIIVAARAVAASGWGPWAVPGC